MTGAPPAPGPRVDWVGDAALRVTFDEVDALDANARVHGLAAQVRAARLPGIRDVVAGMTSLTLHLDTPRVDLAPVLALCSSGETTAAGNPGAASSASGVERPGRLHVLPVTYGGAAGPDLADVARTLGLSAAEVVSRHQSLTYRVCFLGFRPGFGYLGMLPPALRLPRRASPRLRVPAGAVAIADAYTGVYPEDGPGGWHIIGQSQVTLFDPTREPPALFAPGDAVRFVGEADLAAADVSGTASGRSS